MACFCPKTSLIHFYRCSFFDIFIFFRSYLFCNAKGAKLSFASVLNSWQFDILNNLETVLGSLQSNFQVEKLGSAKTNG